ncbi:MAG: 3-deoxy-manno-octulosonate cytidylyltransferase [Acidobacteria bacterium]|nr:3-deoxy-manno-octulosonate cytidylyltransferase [Acidobacteriota bacterium]
MGKLKVVGVIPARLASERLPGKVLLELDGKAMLHHVYDAARACPLLDELLIATDAEPVREYCQRQGIPVRMTSSAHSSGTERIREVADSLAADVYVNIQGDEPLVQAEHVRLLIDLFESGGKGAEVQVTTLKTPLEHTATQNPNVVKVVTDLHGCALYFSRSAIPYRRNAESPLPTYKHLGFYAYRRDALWKYCDLPMTLIEQTERLEQLRFLHHGIPIHVAETSLDTIGVDTREDWEAFSVQWGKRKSSQP